jgi:predicted nucleic acid-binding protein
MRGVALLGDDVATGEGGILQFLRDLGISAYLTPAAEPAAAGRALSTVMRLSADAPGRITVSTWIDRPQAGILHPGERHADIVFGLLKELGTAGNLTTDAHLAALAIEHQAELHSTDADFSRFAGLKWRNPLGRQRP